MDLSKLQQALHLLKLLCNLLRSLYTNHMESLLTGGHMACCCMKCWQDNLHSMEKMRKNCSHRSWNMSCHTQDQCQKKLLEFAKGWVRCFFHVVPNNRAHWKWFKVVVTVTIVSAACHSVTIVMTSLHSGGPELKFLPVRPKFLYNSVVTLDWKWCLIEIPPQSDNYRVECGATQCSCPHTDCSIYCESEW